LVTSLSSRQRRKEARPAELLAAALAIFVEKGFAATRMEDIAARAGVSKGTVFLYFESKQALFRSVIQDAIVPHIAAGEACVEAHPDDHAQVLRELLLRNWRVLSDEHLAGLHKLVLAEAGNFPEMAAFYYENVVVRARSLFVSVLERGIQAGVFRPCDASLMCRLAVAPMMAESVWRPLARQCDPNWVASPDAFIQAHLDLFLRGLLVESSGERNKT